MNKNLLMAGIGIAGLYFLISRGVGTSAAGGYSQWQYPDGTIVTTSPGAPAPYDTSHGGQSHPFVGPLQ
jgi:hypothetical protein